MIVLDTHSLLWWVDGSERLSTSASEAIDRELHSGGKVLVSAITPWEVAMLLQRGRLALGMGLDEWLDAVERIECVELVPVRAQVAVHAVRLPGEFHQDPADRFIVALAREWNVPLVTADEKIQRYPHVRWIWSATGRVILHDLPNRRAGRRQEHEGPVGHPWKFEQCGSAARGSSRFQPIFFAWQGCSRIPRLSSCFATAGSC